MKWLNVLFFCWAVSANASSHVHLDAANINPNDKESLRRGAQYFSNYCYNCHSLALMRFSRISKDLDIPEEDILKTMLFTGAKIGDNMEVNMRGDEAKRWFGTAPPDLSVEARARGVDWIYTYLRSFYRDESRPWGVNNAVFKDVAMPHVLWELQGLQVPVFKTERDEEGVEHQIIEHFDLVEKGKQTAQEFDNTVRDIANFLNYVGEPAKQTRLALGKWVIGFLLVFFIIMYFLKKEYWRDIAKS